ncbi:MAG: DUF664 domain-containing protein [Desulfobacterales bacterium]|jgi:uncharacterized damage-inducible protein DinB|nr:DUF664 domain-containing protein [Desulfobacterales bacterium]
MRELFQLLAEYNKRTNQEVLGILEGLPQEQLSKDLGSYYSSILGIMNHILVTDATWIRRFANNLPELNAVTPQLPTFELKTWKDIVWNSLSLFKPVRTSVDEVIGQVFRLVPEDKYNLKIRYQDYKGQEQHKTVWYAFLHFFNHQTHHRGQVAVLLDQLSVENDFSNLIWKF